MELFPRIQKYKSSAHKGFFAELSVAKYIVPSSGQESVLNECGKIHVHSTWTQHAKFKDDTLIQFLMLYII